MKLKERLMRDRETLRRLEGKAKGRFLWDYYKIPIIVLAAAILLGAIAIASTTRHAKCALYAVRSGKAERLRILLCQIFHLP